MTGDISGELRNWRALHGLTQGQAAEYLCVSVRTLQGWETGKHCGLPRLMLGLLRHPPAEIEHFLKV